MKITSLIFGSLLLVVALLIQPMVSVIHAQSDEQVSPRVQVVEGSLENNQAIKYSLKDLHAGDVLYAYASTVAGNFDPFIGIAAPDMTLASVEASALTARKSSGGNSIESTMTTVNAVFLSTDDDSGTGYDAAISFIIPSDGSYALIVRSSYAKASFGTYRLSVGINEPNVLTGAIEPTSNTLLTVAEMSDSVRISVQEVVGNLVPETGYDVFRLERFAAGDTLYVHVDRAKSDLPLRIILQDFAGKVVGSANPVSSSAAISFEHTFTEDASDYQLIVSATGALSAPTDYRLLVGRNAPEVLAGTAVSVGSRIIARPTEVLVWMDVDQISSVNQADENFTIVGSIYLRWQDPRRAFRPDECGCAYRSYIEDDFSEFTRAGDKVSWPEYVIFNQQGRRETQLRGAVVASDGTVTLTERFTVILQAPNLDFRLFPFDSQTFYFHLDMLFSDKQYVFIPDENHLVLGNDLGEEEFIFHSIEPSVQSVNGVSRFSLRFETYRNFAYYAFRVLFPIALILIITWVTFFVGDFVKRVDVAVANLLVFVAFNFTVSNDLPRLGYLTLLDTILISTFAFTSLTIVLNVYLQWLVKHDRADRAQKLDRFGLALYPLGYIVFNLLLIVSFIGGRAA